MFYSLSTSVINGSSSVNNVLLLWHEIRPFGSTNVGQFASLIARLYGLIVVCSSGCDAFYSRTAISDSDFHVQSNQKMWSETNENVRVDYGDTYFRAFLEKMLCNLQLSSRRTYQVIDDLMHATSAKYPYTRYVPGLKMQLMSDPFMVQPNCVQDLFVHKQMKVACVPFSMRKKKSA